MKVLRLSAAVALVAFASPAFADDAACIQSYESTQTLRKASKLREARAESAKCAVETCPAVLAKDCQKWLAEIEGAMPSVVFEVKAPNGQLLSNVKVTANGKPLVEKVDANPVPVDAGAITFHFESIDGAGKPVDQTVTIKDGEKSHKVAVTLGGASASASASTAEDRPIPIGAIAFGGAGIAAAGVGTVFAILGKSSQSDLDSCKPHCKSGDINGVSTKYAVADILFTAGAVSIIAAAYLFITRPSVSAVQAVGSLGRKPGLVLEF